MTLGDAGSVSIIFLSLEICTSRLRSKGSKSRPRASWASLSRVRGCLGCRAKALSIAKPGDAVLLSPACASFDMFRDYGHRAEVFRAAVARIADDAGVVLEGSE